MFMKRIFIVIFLFLICLNVYGEELNGYARVIDGDSIEIKGIKIRLYGIDAPEVKQICKDLNNNDWKCGLESKARLEKLISNNIIFCKGDNRDRFNRLIAKCYYNNIDLQSWLVLNGLATVYSKYSLEYIYEENIAKNNKVGIWGGDFIYPDKWRSIERENSRKRKVKDSESNNCCKICKKGKACGDSCIIENYNCNKAKGCACNVK